MDKKIIARIDKLNHDMVNKLECELLKILNDKLVILYLDICRLVVSYATYERDVIADVHMPDKPHPIPCTRYCYQVFGKKIGHSASWYNNVNTNSHTKEIQLLSVGSFNNNAPSGVWKERNHSYANQFVNTWQFGNYSKIGERIGMWKCFNYVQPSTISLAEIFSGTFEGNGYYSRNYSRILHKKL